MTLGEFFSWQAYGRAKAKEQAGPIDKGADLPALGDLPAAAIGRAIGGF